MDGVLGFRSPSGSLIPNSTGSNSPASSQVDSIFKSSIPCSSVDKDKNKRAPPVEADSVGSKLIRNLSLMQPNR
jgi:hypothetical protein